MHLPVYNSPSYWYIFYIKSTLHGIIESNVAIDIKVTLMVSNMQI